MTQPDPQLARLILVVVELDSFCYRKCGWCPHSFIDRTGPSKYLPEDVYLRMLADLDGWKGTLSFGRYNEPFGDDVFYARLRQARKALPTATLHTNTNGDFLTMDTLDRAVDAGLTSLRVMLYVSGAWTAFATHRRHAALVAWLPGVEWRLPRSSPGRIVVKTEYRGVAIQARGRDFAADGTNRCGLTVTEPYERTAKCLVASTGAYIDYTGAVMPCCNLRSDHEPHRQYSFGTLTAEAGSLARILGSPQAAAWRRAGNEGVPPGEPCKACRFAVGG